MKYAYARVSTRKQSRDGNGLEVQVAKLKAEGYDELVIEDPAGSSTKRPRLEQLIQRLSCGDILIVTKIDRLARTVIDGSAIINDLLKHGVSVHILDMGLIIIDLTPSSKLIINVLLAFAEYERDLTIERTQARKEIARTKNGFRDGRPPIDQKRKDLAVDLIINQRKSYNEVVELTGLSKSTVSRAVREARAKRILDENSLRDVK